VVCRAAAFPKLPTPDLTLVGPRFIPGERLGVQRRFGSCNPLTADVSAGNPNLLDSPPNSTNPARDADAGARHTIFLGRA
jgi:hypothetical protein